MQNASPNVPTQDFSCVVTGLDDAVKAFLWAMPTADFYIYVDPNGSGVTVTGPNGTSYHADGVHPAPLCLALHDAMARAFYPQPPAAIDRDKGVAAGDLEVAFGYAIAACPDHIIRVGRRGNQVWASVDPVEDAGERIELDARLFSLSEALVCALALFHRRDALRPHASPLSAPEALEVA